jgi:hypothetical protein
VPGEVTLEWKPHYAWKFAVRHLAGQQMHAGMACLKADPLLDPLRAEPRFQAIERQLKVPD